MKKILLHLFILSSLYSSSSINLPSNMMHSHEHIDELGTTYIYEHSHVEVSKTLYCETINSKDIFIFEVLKVENKNTLNSKSIKNSIFRPPIV